MPHRLLRPLALAAAPLLAATPLLAAITLSPPQAAVEAAMAASAAGWNAGDLDRFVAIYAPDAIFVTTKGLVRGKAAIAERYRPSFAATGNTRGKLAFQPLAFRTIDPVHQLLIARWTLTPADPAHPPETGMTTLLLERQPTGWKIISDHSD